MRVRPNTTGLRETTKSEFFVRLLFGGTVTLLAGIVANRFGPVVGGFLLAFPAIFPATATLTFDAEKRKKEKQGLNGAERGKKAAALCARGAALGSGGMICFGLCAWLLLSRVPAAGAIAVATVVWAIVAAGAWYVRRKVFG